MGVPTADDHRRGLSGGNAGDVAHDTDMGHERVTINAWNKEQVIREDHFQDGQLGSSTELLAQLLQLLGFFTAHVFTLTQQLPFAAC